MVMADPEASHAFHSEARRLSAELGELELEGFATFFRGLMQTLNMAVEPARADLEAAIALHRRANSRVGEGMALATLGLTFLITDEPARARELLEQALAIHTAAGYPLGRGAGPSLPCDDDRNDRSSKPLRVTTAGRSNASSITAIPICWPTR